RERVGKSCGERSFSAQDLEIAVPPTERTNRTRDKICVQEHVEANLSDYLLSVGWACVLHNDSQSSRAQDLINALPELGILRGALPLPTQGRAKGGKDRYGRKPCLDIVTQVLLAGFHILERTPLHRPHFRSIERPEKNFHVCAKFLEAETRQYFASAF